MQSLPLTQLRALAAVYAAGGVRPAARELGIAHSALSRHLRSLQDWIGTPLFEGGGRKPLVFTPGGMALARAAAASLSDLERAVDALRDRRRARSVAVVTTSSLAVRWLLPRLPNFTTSHADIDLSVFVNGRVSDPAEQLADLALRMGQGPWPERDATPLMDEWLYPVMSPVLWAQLGEPSDPSRLVDTCLLQEGDPGAAWGRWLDEHPVPGLDVRSGRRFSSSDLVLRAAVQGIGVALARHRFAADDVEARMLVRPFGDLAVRVRDAYWLVCASGARERQAVRTAIEWLEAEAGADAPFPERPRS